MHILEGRFKNECVIHSINEMFKTENTNIKGRLIHTFNNLFNKKEVQNE